MLLLKIYLFHLIIHFIDYPDFYLEMKELFIIWLLGWAIAATTNVDPEELIERAIQSIQNDLTGRMKNGDTSKRSFPRKITPLYDTIITF